MPIGGGDEGAVEVGEHKTAGVAGVGQDDLADAIGGGLSLHAGDEGDGVGELRLRGAVLLRELDEHELELTQGERGEWGVVRGGLPLEVLNGCGEEPAGVVAETDLGDGVGVGGEGIRRWSRTECGGGGGGRRETAAGRGWGEGEGTRGEGRGGRGGGERATWWNRTRGWVLARKKGRGEGQATVWPR